MAKNWAQLILQYRLHSVFDSKDRNLVDLVTALSTVVEEGQTTLNQLEGQLTVTDGTEETLDGFGGDYGVTRLEGEEDADYRDRVKDAMQGRGVTRPRIESAINQILGGTYECEIIKWNEAGGLLDNYTFALDLPVYDLEGFYLDDEGLDGEEDGAYLDIGTYTFSWINLSTLFPIQAIIDMVTMLKPSGSNFVVWSGDYNYEIGG
jgi:hypothetical protein